MFEDILRVNPYTSTTLLLNYPMLKENELFMSHYHQVVVSIDSCVYSLDLVFFVPYSNERKRTSVMLFLKGKAYLFMKVFADLLTLESIGC